jgi:hypothetical protein
MGIGRRALIWVLDDDGLVGDHGVGKILIVVVNMTAVASRSYIWCGGCVRGEVVLSKEKITLESRVAARRNQSQGAVAIHDPLKRGHLVHEAIEVVDAFSQRLAPCITCPG